MRVLFLEDNSDHPYPIVEIVPEDKEEAFNLGVLAQKIWGDDLCAWSIKTGLRIPLMKMNLIGLADFRKVG